MLKKHENIFDIKCSNIFVVFRQSLLSKNGM